MAFSDNDHTIEFIDFFLILSPLITLNNYYAHSFLLPSLNFHVYSVFIA